MRMKIIFILPFLLIPALTGKAQQQPILSQYVMNKYLINPAFAGATGYTNINITARRQYFGFQNAPQTFLLSAETRLLEDNWIQRKPKVEKKTSRASRVRHIGLGGYVFNDRNGIIDRTGLGFSYAYHINFPNVYQLSFGLSVTGYQFKLNDQGAFLTDEGDPLLLGSKKNFFVPDASTGIYISGKGFYSGLSVSELFGSYLQLGPNKFGNYHAMRHFNLIAGYKWAISDNLMLEPSFLARATINSYQMEVSTRVFYKQNLWIGFNYRSNETFVSMFGFMVDAFYLGYAYDASMGAIRNYSGGSHEIIAGFRIGDNNTQRARWLRPDISEIGE